MKQLTRTDSVNASCRLPASVTWSSGCQRTSWVPVYSKIRQPRRARTRKLEFELRTESGIQLFHSDHYLSSPPLLFSECSLQRSVPENRLNDGKVTEQPLHGARYVGEHGVFSVVGL
jgi:hypothetical protein